MGRLANTTSLLIGMTLALVGPALADEWAAYGRDPGASRYAPLTQITPRNVARLKPAWTFHTGDISYGSGGVPKSGFETTPILIDGRLYLTTPFNRVIALDPATGRQVWAYDPRIDRQRPYGDGLINRGLAAWRDPRPPTKSCRVRLFEATLDARLLALDAATGVPCQDFGDSGEVGLQDVDNYQPGRYHMTSPPVVLDGVVVVGSAIDDNARVEMPSGAVRGYDARTGRRLWAWEPLQRPAGIAVAGWRTGAANAWSILTADPRRHLVYVPTGSASPDYYGGLRPGDNRWADSVVALDSRTGKLAWGFQLVHHDLWDYDTAAAPLVTSMSLNSRLTPVLIAANKTGMVFVLDPSTGKPVLPIEERPVPQSRVPGELTAATQPFPTTTPPLARHTLSPDEGWGATDADREACRRDLSALVGRSIFSPPDTAASLEIPGAFGGINWSGFAWDAKRQRLIVAVSNLPFKLQLIPAAAFAGGAKGDFRGDSAPQTGAPYAISRTPMMGPSGLPCAPPPWGELVAVDLAAGKIAWRRPVGSMEEVFPAAVAPGSVTLGGPVVTAGGLIFMGGTMDRRLHALSAETGQELWSSMLPASAHASPITYQVGRRQFVVIAAGGSAKIDQERQADALVAFALP